MKLSLAALIFFRVFGITKMTRVKFGIKFWNKIESEKLSLEC